MSVNKIVMKQINTKMVTSFPNVNISFRMDQKLSFKKGEKLAAIKYWAKKLSILSLLKIEHELFQEINTKKIIEIFANKKCHKKN